MQAREQYHRELQAIRKDIQLMTDMSIKQIKRGLESVEKDDPNLASAVISNDREIDDLETKIADSCIKLIAREQPVASDLRVVVSSIKLVSSIARIGDHARHLATSRKWLSDTSKTQFFPIIRKMAELGIKMLQSGIRAFMHQDIFLASTTAALDARIDKLRKKLGKKIIAFMQADPENVDEGAHLLFLNRFMERLGDHVTNLCECVHFAKTGKHIELN